MEREIILNRVYKHFKGDLYIVLDIAIHSETKEKMVIYRGLYENGLLYARPYDSVGSKSTLSILNMILFSFSEILILLSQLNFILIVWFLPSSLWNGISLNDIPL